MTNPFFEHQDCVILLHQGLKQKNTLTRAWKNHSKLRHFKKIRDQMTSYLGQVENNQPPHVLRIKYAADGVPIHYTVYSSRFWLRSLGLFWASAAFEMVVVWSQGLKGSVDMTFKPWSSVPPLSQEMNFSHGLCLSQEKQQATWESASSHGLYQRFLSEPIKQSSSAMKGDSHESVFCQSKRCSGSCIQQFKADLKLIEQLEMWKFYLCV